MPDDSELFIARLRKAIGDVSIRAFAERCGVSEGALRANLRGTEPSRSALINISRASGVNLEWLATGEGPMRPGDAASSLPFSSDKGLKGYPEVGAEDVLEVLGMVEALLLETGKKLSPEQKVEMVRLACEILMDQDREAWIAARKAGKPIDGQELTKVGRRLLRLAG